MLLVIDTSTRYGGVALHREGKLLASLAWHSVGNHTRELLPSLHQLLARAGGQLKEVDGIAVALGPGGFSALRVGLSTAKGLAVGLNVPLVGVGTLEMEAFPYKDTGLPVCALLSVARGEVATALFAEAEGWWTKLEEERIVTPEELAAATRHRTLFCGEGAPTLNDFLKERLGDKAVVMRLHTPALRLAALASLAAQRLARGQADNVATLQPMYLRRPSIGQAKEPQRVKLGRETRE